MNYPEMRVDIIQEFATFPPGVDLRRRAGFSIIRRTGGRGVYNRLGRTPKGGRPVRLIMDQHQTLYQGAADASRRTGVPQGTLYKILSGWENRKSSRGYVFRYVDSTPEVDPNHAAGK